MLYLSLIYLFSFTKWGTKISKRNKIIFASIPFLLINFMRFGYGADYFSYWRLYQDVGFRTFKQVYDGSAGLEPLYVLISFVSNNLGIDYHIFAGLFTSVISLIFIIWMSEVSDNFEWSVLLFYVMHYPVWNLSALRQGISMAILAYFLFNTNRQFTTKTKIITVVVATLFHYGSLIVAVLYLASSRKWKKRWFIYLLLISPIFRLLLKPEVLIYFKNVPIIGEFTKYLSGNQVSLFGFTTAVRLFFFGVMYFYYDRLNDNYPNSKIMFNFIILSFLLYLYIPFSTVVATRLTVFGYILTVIVFPMIVSLYRDERFLMFRLKNVFVLGLSVFSVLSFYNEYDKMIDRTGYNGSLTDLNQVTIFNGDFNDFNKQYSLMVQIRESNRLSMVDNLLVDKSNSLNPEVETAFSDENTYFVSRLPRLDTQVIIDDQGHILEVIEPDTNVTIISNVKETKHEGNMFTNFSDFTNLSDGNKVDDDRLREIVIDNSLKNNERLRTSFIKSQFNISDIDKNEKLFSYNMLPVENSYIYADQLGSKFKYLEISTSYERYYALISHDNKILIDKWYNKLSIQNNNGIVIGYTTYSKEYINAYGEIIWIESLNK